MGACQHKGISARIDIGGRDPSSKYRKSAFKSCWKLTLLRVYRMREKCWSDMSSADAELCGALLRCSHYQRVIDCANTPAKKFELLLITRREHSPNESRPKLALCYPLIRKALQASRDGPTNSHQLLPVASGK